MTETSPTEYQAIVKKAWTLYIIATIVFIVVLVLFVARDLEEQFFYTIMPAAAAYVLRPTRRYMQKLIKKYTGVEPPPAEDKPSANKDQAS